MSDTPTNPVDEAPAEAPEVVEADAPETTEAADADDALAEGEQAEPEVDDDLEDVEWEGKKVRIPPEVKAALMRTADYTRKTQEVAQTRQALAEREQSLVQQAEAVQVLTKELGELARVESEIEGYQKLTQADWAAIRESDRDVWQDHRDNFRDLQLQRDKLAAEVTTKKQNHALEMTRAAEAERAKQIQEGVAVLNRDIKGWGPDLAGKITTFAHKEFGISPQELASFTDPRVIKVLHRAMEGSDALSKQKATARVQSAQQTAPARTVGGVAPAARRTTDASGDGLSTAEWMRREDEREAAKRKQRA